VARGRRIAEPLFWLVVVDRRQHSERISSRVSALMDLPVRPVTSQMLGFVRYGLLQFVLVVIVFYSGS
jgi:hypothetical protein